MKRLEQRELLRESAISVLAAPDLAGGRVEPQVADLEDRRALDGAAAAERAQAGEQLHEGERLDEVVVGPAVEARDAVLHGVAGGEHEHRRPTPSARSRLHVSKPSRPGSITSSTIASYSVGPAIQSASSPLIATSAA